LANSLVEQLLEIMPELREVVGWNTTGPRRTLDNYGRAVERQISDNVLRRTTR
jgi:hypothetical protein